jgi:hypothetical protein
MPRGRDIKKKMSQLREKLSVHPEEEERERIERETTLRIWRAISDEMGTTRAGGGRRGGNPPGPVQVPIVEQVYGPAWTYRQWDELVVGRVFTPERLDNALGTGEAHSNEDLRPHFDLENQDLEELKAEWMGAMREMHASMHKDDGEAWDDVNKWYRERLEKAEAERQRAIQGEWEL